MLIVIIVFEPEVDEIIVEPEKNEEVFEENKPEISDKKVEDNIEKAEVVAEKAEKADIGTEVKEDEKLEDIKQTKVEEIEKMEDKKEDKRVMNFSDIEYIVSARQISTHANIYILRKRSTSVLR